LIEGRVLLYFFDPECAHCDQAARRMATHAWKADARILAVPTTQKQWGAAFVRETKLPAALTLDSAPLREVFKFTDPPYAVALRDGRQQEALPFFDEKEPETTLRRLGFIE
jgi:hypothetical protein